MYILIVILMLFQQFVYVLTKEEEGVWPVGWENKIHRWETDLALHYMTAQPCQLGPNVWKAKFCLSQARTKSEMKNE